MKESETIKKIELYLEGRLQREEHIHFEELLKNDKKISTVYISYKQAIEKEIHNNAKSGFLNNQNSCNRKLNY